MRRAVGQAMFGLEHGDYLGVLDQATGRDQRQPVRHRLAIAGLDVADLRGDTFICGGHERCLFRFQGFQRTVQPGAG